MNYDSSPPNFLLFPTQWCHFEALIIPFPFLLLGCFIAREDLKEKTEIKVPQRFRYFQLYLKDPEIKEKKKEKKKLPWQIANRQNTTGAWSNSYNRTKARVDNYLRRQHQRQRLIIIYYYVWIWFWWLWKYYIFKKSGETLAKHCHVW